ncbi:hypothetical protein KPL70_009062 [Citrus sinensis]|nr:hypothetical protein KPL70_009062 [Citrus sinensis]
MLTGSTDRSILATDVETGATIARLEDSHEDAIYSLINVTESTVASGDDQDMTFAADAMKLLGTSKSFTRIRFSGYHKPACRLDPEDSTLKPAYRFP